MLSLLLDGDFWLITNSILRALIYLLFSLCQMSENWYWSFKFKRSYWVSFCHFAWCCFVIFIYTLIHVEASIYDGDFMFPSYMIINGLEARFDRWYFCFLIGKRDGFQGWYIDSGATCYVVASLTASSNLSFKSLFKNFS